MSSLRFALYFLLVQVSKCYFFSEYPKNVPFLDYYVTSTNLLDFHNISEMKKNIINDRLLFEVKFGDDLVLKIAIRLKNIEVVNWKTNVSIYKENTEDYIDVKNENFGLVEGFVISNQNASSVVGYIKNTYFYGTIFFGELIYYIEDLNNYLDIFDKYRNSKYNAVIYKENFLNLRIPRNYDEEKPNLFNKHVDFSLSNNEKKLYKTIIGNGKVCTLFVLADNAFLRIIHKNNIKSAIAQVLTSVEEANSLFRSTDFDNDGYPDNIGLLVKYIIVLESERSPMNMFPVNKDNLIDSDIFLNIFSQYELLREVCLGLAITGYAFKHNILGVSYTATATDKKYFKYSLGGICNRPRKYQTGKNFNALAISVRRKNGDILPQHIFDLSVAHELGHSFGSDHDVSKSCMDHVMTANAPMEIRRKHFTFSNCSKEMILRTIISRGHCLENYKGPFCGNGIIEQGETCDCGTIRDCQDLDVCCISRGRKKSCEVNKKMGYECHPSQGMCCTSKCKYKDLSKFDLECENFEKTCPCGEISKPCTCGINGRCTGNICSSEECTRISLLECGCPTNITYNKCKICCSYNNSCLPASLLTEMLIERHKTLVTRLKLLQNKKKFNNDKFGFYKTLYFDNQSLKLHFREVKVNDYCLLYGQLGTCSLHFKCTTSKVRQIYPSIKILRTQNSVDKEPVNCKVLLILGTVSLLFLMRHMYCTL